jgi:predicted AAA+ superfamily ATPase
MEWKNDPHKKSLLIKGARQVGKTYTIDDFAKKNYGTYIHINFEENPEYAAIFSDSRAVETIMRNMSNYFPNAEFVPGDTLIFLDEIQSCPDARVAFKFFTMDGRYDIIGSGSLLGVRYKEVSSYPVGYEDVIDMYSLDFEEFLWAMGFKEGHINALRASFSKKEPLGQAILNRFNEYMRLYMMVGGMPEAVKIFKETNHLGKVLNVQKRIVSGYLDDITKYATWLDKGRVRATFESIPAQLSKKNKKFMYGDVEGTKGRGHETYAGGLLWLYEADIINICYNLTEPALPLMINRRDNIFKVYLRDTGLMTSMMEDGLSKALLNGDIDVNEGAIMENMVADMLGKNGYELMYFEKNGSLEIDFILNLDGIVSAIEVKSGINRKAKSLNMLMSPKYTVKRGIMLEGRDIFVDEKGVEHYPIFAAAFMRSL